MNRSGHQRHMQALKTNSLGFYFGKLRNVKEMQNMVIKPIAEKTELSRLRITTSEPFKMEGIDYLSNIILSESVM